MRVRRRTLTLTAGTAFLAAGCGAGAERPAVAGAVIPDAQRRPAPDVSGTLLDGGPFTTASMSFALLVVNFWASWCPPCRVEADDLNAVHAATRDSDVVFVGVNFRDQRDAAKAFAGKFGLGYPSVFDPAGKVALEFYDFAPNPQPATVLIDRRRRVAAVFNGAVTEEQLRRTVDMLLA